MLETKCSESLNKEMGCVAWIRTPVSCCIPCAKALEKSVTVKLTHRERGRRVVTRSCDSSVRLIVVSFTLSSEL